MKLTHSLRFPHPVLTPYTGDFVDQQISFTCDIFETAGTNELTIDYHFSVTDSSIQNLCASGRFAALLSVVSLETLFNTAFKLEEAKGQITIPGGALNGKTRIRPLIAVQKSVPAFRSPNIHPEFGDQSFDMRPGDLIGFDDEVVINVGREKLAPMESIFRISKADDLEEGEMGIDLEKPWIEIRMSPALYDATQSLRNNSRFLPIVLNSIYAPAIMHVVNTLSSGDQNFADLRWHRIFTAKCDHLGINLDNPDALEVTQRLLHRPLKEIIRFVEVALNEP